MSNNDQNPNDELTRLQATLAELQAELQRKEDQIIRERIAIAERDEALAQSEAKLAKVQDELVATRDELNATIAELKRALGLSNQATEVFKLGEAELQRKFGEIIRLMYGRKSERYVSNPELLYHDLVKALGVDAKGEPVLESAVRDGVEGLKDAVVVLQDESTDERQSSSEIESQGPSPNETAATSADHELPQKQKPKRIRERRGLPENLPVVERVVDLDETHKQGLREIGVDCSDRLIYEPGKLYIERTLYKKYADPKDSERGVFTPERENRQAVGGLYSPALAAQIIVYKHGLHVPIYRMQDVFAGLGWTPTRSTLLNIKTSAYDLLEPLIRSIEKRVLTDSVLCVDETPVTLLLRHPLGSLHIPKPRYERYKQRIAEALAENRTTLKAQVWVYEGVERPLLFFGFDISRVQVALDEQLIDGCYEGVVVADCWSGYEQLPIKTQSKILHAGCHSHSRRNFFDARNNNLQLADRILLLYQQLYDFEDQIKNADFDTRAAMRDGPMRQVWERLKAELVTEEFKALLPKESLGKAVNYVMSRTSSLEVCFSNPLVPLDNNSGERKMRYVANGRKNWLFVGSVRAGIETAGLMTLVYSARRNDIDAQAYLTDVLERLLQGESDLESLHPDRWREVHPEAVCTYREEERRDRADRKERDRAERRKRKQALERKLGNHGK